MRNNSENAGNWKQDLCGQSPLVDTKSMIQIKKTADFVRNQPFLLVRVGRFELPASWSQTRRPTNWATPGYEIEGIFPKWSNMWSKANLDQSGGEVKGKKCYSRNGFSGRLFCAVHIVLQHPKKMCCQICDTRILRLILPRQ